MKLFLSILSLLPWIAFAQSRLPNFPTYSMTAIPEQDLSFPKVQKISYLESDFNEDDYNIKLKYDLFYQKNILESVNFINASDSSVFMSHFFDEYSRIIKEERFSKGTAVKTTYEYDEKNLRSIKTQFDESLLPVKKTVVEYNKLFLPLRKTEFTNDSKPICIWTYKYNGNGDLIEEVFKNVPNDFIDNLNFDRKPDPYGLSRKRDYTTRFSILYDSLKRPIAKTEYLNSKIRIRNEYTYSKDSTSSKTVYYNNYSVGIRPRHIETLIKHDSTTIFKFQALNVPDSTNFQGENTTISVNKIIKTFSQRSPNYNKTAVYKTDIQYDSNKNWIKKTTYIDGRKAKILERVIIY
jgi:hypothetical protein